MCEPIKLSFANSSDEWLQWNPPAYNTIPYIRATSSEWDFFSLYPFSQATQGFNQACEENIHGTLQPFQ